MFGRNNAASRNTLVTLGSSGGGWLLVASVALVIGTLAAPRVHVRAGARAARAAFGTFFGAATPLSDETVSVPTASSRGVPIRIPFSGELQVEVNVVDGTRVNVHVIGAADWGALQKAGGRLLNGRFRFDFPEFQALSATQAKLSGRLYEGSYFVVIENPTLSPAAAGAADVHIVASVRP